MPHGTCFLWYPEILYTQAISDVVIGISYYAVAVALIYFVYQRDDIPFKWFFIPFGTLIFAACGTVHVLGAWTLWTPDFGVQTIAKVITAIVSMPTGVLVWVLMPKIIALPSPQQFAAAKLELADIKLKSTEKDLEESEQRFRDFAENGADWFWETDSDLRFSYVSGKYEEILGMPSEILIGKKRLKIIQNYDDIATPKWKEHLGLFENHQAFSNFEYLWRRPDGGYRTVNTSGKPRFDAGGNFLGYRGVGRDVTERVNLEQQVRRSQKMEAIGQLTGGIAHDFNNILGIIQGNLELIETMVIDDSDASHRVKKAQKGVVRGANITRKLLGFSRKDLHKVNVILVSDLVANLVDLIAKSLTVSINVKTMFEENLWRIAVDDGDLEDALLNLALNARDAMPEGGTLVIEVANKILDDNYFERSPEGQPGDYVMISVSDTGVGMDPEIKRKALEPFFTTKNEKKGTGLGLSMVHGFVQRSGGHMKIYSETGIGTTFRLYLPRVYSGTTANLKSDMVDVDAVGGTETILIVDDEEALREVAIFHLEKLGYRTLIAENGKQALAILSENKDIDLLFSDVVMPGGMDGYEVARKCSRQRPEIKILLTSGFTKAREEILQGSDQFLIDLTQNLLSKPYSYLELALAIRQTIDRKK